MASYFYHHWIDSLDKFSHKLTTNNSCCLPTKKDQVFELKISAN